MAGRLALGVSYRGTAYDGWQSQPSGNTVQDQLEKALSAFASERSVSTVCAGRTDAGVHAMNQVVHLDAPVERDLNSWVRGTNRYLPADIAVQWCSRVSPDFHARFDALARRYAFVVLQSPVRPAIEAGQVSWVFRPLNEDAMQRAAAVLLGEHDFSAFRSSQCQAASPVRTLRALGIARRHSYWRFDFEANAFLHHMVRNLMGCLIAVGQGTRSVAWLSDVLASCDRRTAAPTFPPDGLYFLGPQYDAKHRLPVHTAAMDWLP